MEAMIDHEGRKRLAELTRRLAVGRITNEEFESQRPNSKEIALFEVYFYGLWPLYDDFVEHKLIGRWALTPEGRAWVARIVLFLRSGLPYCYPRLTGLAQLPVLLCSLATLGWVGRLWRRRQWKDGDESVWPFFSRSEYDEARRNPVYLSGGKDAQQRVAGDAPKAARP
ncbi:MAG: hypothetical protein RKP20_00005 [Candidatus Competibacter sp.]|nr:hypothetical protein [Candidatus Competibacter sp.]